MNLIKENWTKEDIEEFNKYLISIKNKDKITWTKNIVNTNKQVLAIKTKELKDIAKQIYRGNYLSFLNNMNFDIYENTIIYAYLIVKIKDFNTLKKYLEIYSNNIDNWSSCDTLKFNIKNNIEDYKKLVNEYIKSNKTFKRRIGIIILFEFIKQKEIIFIFDIINKLKQEQEYYVNMAIAWLLCECFIKEQNKTIEYLNNNEINIFVKNKLLQKCRDSYRINNNDLLKIK